MSDKPKHHNLPVTRLTPAEYAAWEALRAAIAATLPPGVAVNDSAIRRAGLAALAQRYGVAWPE